MKPLTDMTASELLDEFSVLIHKLTVTPDAPEMAARRFALHGELLRRLAALPLLRQIVNDLPSSRDWLDPAIEKQAREIVK